MLKLSPELAIELFSSKGCPYGQACLSALAAAELDYTLVPVSVRDIPDWVVETTPKGQVPVLRIGEQVVFESSAICELVNDLAGGVLLPQDPLARAWMRSWSLYVATLNPLFFQAVRAADADEFDAKIAALQAAIEPLERALATAPAAAAAGRVWLIDCAYFTLFTRLLHMEAYLKRFLVDAPRLRAWALAATEAIARLHPVLATHGDVFITYYASADGYLSTAAPDPETGAR